MDAKFYCDSVGIELIGWKAKLCDVIRNASESTSLKKQKMILNPNGILFHSFWHGKKIEEHHGLLFVYYTEDELRNMIKNDYNILKIQKYTEFEKNDSIYIILQRK